MINKLKAVQAVCIQPTEGLGSNDTRVSCITYQENQYPSFSEAGVNWTITDNNPFSTSGINLGVFTLVGAEVLTPQQGISTIVGDTYYLYFNIVEPQLAQFTVRVNGVVIDVYDGVTNPDFSTFVGTGSDTVTITNDHPANKSSVSVSFSSIELLHEVTATGVYDVTNNKYYVDDVEVTAISHDLGRCVGGVDQDTRYVCIKNTEQLMLNSDFSNGLTDWTLNNISGLSGMNGVDFELYGGDSVEQTLTTEVGVVYRIRAERVAGNSPNGAEWFISHNGVQLGVFNSILTNSSIEAIFMGTGSDVIELTYEPAGHTIITSFTVVEEVVKSGVYDVLDDSYTIDGVTVTPDPSDISSGCSDTAPYEFQMFGAYLQLTDTKLNSIGVDLAPTLCVSNKAIKTITADYTATSDDHTLLVDTTAGPVDIAINPSQFYNTFSECGQMVYIKALNDTNPITITATSGVIWDDKTNTPGSVYTFTANDLTIPVQSDGTNLYIL